MIANILTYIRFLFSPILLVIIIYSDGYELLAFVSFVALALTDYFDGIAARIENKQKDIGLLIDPLADKALFYGAGFALLHLELIPHYFIFAILIRDFLINIIRFNSHDSHLYYPILSAKLKTFMQFFLIGIILLSRTNLWYNLNVEYIFNYHFFEIFYFALIILNYLSFFQYFSIFTKRSINYKIINN